MKVLYSIAVVDDDVFVKEYGQLINKNKPEATIPMPIMVTTSVDGADEVIQSVLHNALATARDEANAARLKNLHV